MTRTRSYPIPTRKYPKERPLEVGRPFRGRISNVLGLLLLVGVLLGIGVGPELWRLPPEKVAPEEALQGPCTAHPLGTDAFGRDVLSRLLHGGRVSVSAGAMAVLMAATIGSTAGMLAGYVGGLLDTLVSALTEVLLTFPSLLLALMIAFVFGSGVFMAAVAVGIASIPLYVRLSRASVKRIRRAQFVRAAKAVGAKDVRIIFYHVLPNIMGPILSLGVLDLGWAILHVSALSYLGVGAQPPQAEWGAMLSDASAYMRQAPWLAMAPGFAIAMTVFSANLVGDSLQESLDPLASTLP